MENGFTNIPASKDNPRVHNPTDPSPAPVTEAIMDFLQHKVHRKITETKHEIGELVREETRLITQLTLAYTCAFVAIAFFASALFAAAYQYVEQPLWLLLAEFAALFSIAFICLKNFKRP
jgi:hypothetical protein